jgi:hypothetical protein
MGSPGKKYTLIRDCGIVAKLYLHYLTAMGSGEKEKLPPCRIPTVGIVQKVPSTTNTTIPKHHHHGGAVGPSYGVRLMDPPNPTQVTSSEGVERGRFSLVLYETIK